jgi:hypothetical protein
MLLLPHLIPEHSLYTGCFWPFILHTVTLGIIYTALHCTAPVRDVTFFMRAGEGLMVRGDVAFECQPE